jgi:hypothetical protein
MSSIKRYILLSLILLTASCGSSADGPSSEELNARQIVEPSVRSMFARLPQPEVVPGYAVITVGGRYHALEATIQARYWTNARATEVCRSFLKALNAMDFQTRHAYNGECLERTYGDQTHRTIDGDKNDNLISISFSATERKGQQNVEINIYLMQTLDLGRWRECVTDDAGRVNTFCDAGWHETLMHQLSQ